MQKFYTMSLAAAAAFALAGAGCVRVGTRDATSGQSSGYTVPEVTSAIVLKDCKATPKIYQAKEESTITFKNQDAIEHIVLLDSKTYTVAANGILNLAARFSLPAPTTINYLCDNTSNGDAIFVTP